jgi:hypothetical protein
MIIAQVLKGHSWNKEKVILQGDSPALAYSMENEDLTNEEIR